LEVIEDVKNVTLQFSAATGLDINAHMAFINSAKLREEGRASAVEDPSILTQPDPVWMCSL